MTESEQLPELPGAAPTPNAAEFFEGLEAGEVRVQVCTACGEARLPKRVYCTCGSAGSSWRATTAAPTLHSYTVVHRAPTKEFEPLAPYGLGLVDFEPGCRLVAQLDWQPRREDIGGWLDVRVERVSSGFRIEAARASSQEQEGRDGIRHDP